MKKLIVLFTCITLATHAVDEFREFTANDGCTLIAKVLSYDTKMDTVEIQRDDFQILSVKSSAFSEADQAYVKQWAASSLFMSPLKFTIIPRRTVEESSNEEYPHNLVSEYQYEITLCNRTGQLMENLTMDYIIYYVSDLESACLQESHAWTNRDGLQEDWSLASTPRVKVVKGTFPIGSLEVGGWEKFTTDRVSVLQQHSENLNREEMMHTVGSGIRVTISMATPDGGRVERSFSLPKDTEQILLQDLTGEGRTSVARASASGQNP